MKDHPEMPKAWCLSWKRVLAGSLWFNVILMASFTALGVQMAFTNWIFQQCCSHAKQEVSIQVKILCNETVISKY